MKPTIFPTAAALRRWFETHHETATELLLQLKKTGSSGPGVTYAEALDEALCFGWIDGVRRRVDDDYFTIRFTPRRPGSIWSLVNVGHIERLTAAGRMHPAGQKAFAARTAARTGVYSFENRPQSFPPELERVFRQNRPAWDFFAAQPAGYRRVLTWWVVSAKQAATRERRLARIIECSAAGKRVDLAKRFD
jgi:uncharacterized protein YdeI (YjbR/CyaY-like superfamily)